MKLPAFQFYPGDWLKDPALRMCSPATRGIWLDWLCAMHELDRCGQLTGTVAQLARVGSCTTDEVAATLAELKSTDAADVETDGHSVVTVRNRRMRREWEERKSACDRKRRERGKELVTEPSPPRHDASHADVTPESRSPSSSSTSASAKEREGTGDRLHGIPASVEEVIEFGKTLRPVVSEDTCRKFWSHYEGQARTNANGETFWITSGDAIVTNWKAKLPSFGDTRSKAAPADPASGIRHPASADGVPVFAALPSPLFPAAAKLMLAACDAAIEAVKRDPANAMRELKEDVRQLIEFLEKEQREGWEARVNELRTSASSYLPKLTPKAKEIIAAYRRRRDEINRAAA